MHTDTHKDRHREREGEREGGREGEGTVTSHAATPTPALVFNYNCKFVQTEKAAAWIVYAGRYPVLSCNVECTLGNV